MSASGFFAQFYSTLGICSARARLVAFVLTAAVFIFPYPVLATTVTWVGSGDGISWSDPNNSLHTSTHHPTRR